MSNERLEGQNAKASREARESIAKLLGNISDNHQVIVIAKDLTGATPTHVHAQGPVNDTGLFYGMLEQGRDVFQTSELLKKISELQEIILTLDQRIKCLEEK